MDTENRGNETRPCLKRKSSMIASLPLDAIHYCHGFASCFDPEKSKVKTLTALAPVNGVTVDYTLPPNEVFASFVAAIGAQRNILVVGTSMGGFYSAWLGSQLGLPFIAINPATMPSNSLRKYVGRGTTHYGTPFTLSADVIDAYAELPFRLDGNGMIAVDLGDEVIDAYSTIKTVGEKMRIVTFAGGSHRFDHMPELVDLIQKDLSGPASSHS